jgi:membrane-associated protease RseP (regulator of RpoE activity)
VTEVGEGSPPWAETAPTRYERWRDGVTGGYSPPGTPGGPPEIPPGSRGRAVASLLLTLVLVILLAWEAHVLSIVAIVAVIAAVVMLHEAGHFTAAKLSGMKVTEFFLGFGPRLWSIRKGETEYGVKLIPAGGYCRIVGMNNLEQVDPADEPRTYRQASFWRRFAVGVAGSTVHFILALVTVWALFAFAHQKATASVGSLLRIKGETPAQMAGFEPGDRFLSYDGHKVTSWDAMHTYIETRIGKSITFVVERKGQDLTLTATPADE